MLDAEHFAVADDEGNTIRVYRLDERARPVYSLDASRFLRFERRAPEADIEGAARINNRIYWIGSHGRNAKGEPSESRQRLFATDILPQPGAPRLVLVGSPYTRLLKDLTTDRRYQQYDLAGAAARPPKAAGGLNIEGLAATPEGGLLVGFRSPIVAGRALIVPLLNPDGVIEGAAARLGDPLLIDLGGQGIRSISDWRGQYLLVAGAAGEGGDSRLFAWAGLPRSPTPVAGSFLAGLNPESVAVIPQADGDRLLLVSDDGTRIVGKRPAKRIKDQSRRPFRAMVMPLPPLETDVIGVP